MATTIPDLWPVDFGTSKQPSPASILRQQAYLLGQRTRNFVLGEVVSRTENTGSFLHTLALTDPLLDFHQNLLHVKHGIDFYPAELAIYRDDFSSTPEPVRDAEEFMNRLKLALGGERIVNLVRSLIDQCRDPEEGE